MKNQADNQYKFLVETIHRTGYWDTDYPVRTRWKDGNPAHTKSTSSLFMRFDNSEVPILTTKYVAWKSAIKELLWIWQKKSNKVQDLRDMGVNIWNEWEVVKRKNKLVYLKPIIFEGKHNGNSKIEDVKIREIIDENAEIKKSNNFGDFYVLEKDWRSQRYKIQFVKTGFVNYVTSGSVSVGEVKDYYFRSVSGLGYYGDYKNEKILNYFGKHFYRWVNTWENMIRRCFSNYKNQWNEYDKCFVSEQFQSCEKFLLWVMENNKLGKSYLGELQIDKDYYGGSRVYSPETCTLLTPKENTSLTLKEWFVVVNENIVFYSKSDLANYMRDTLKLSKTHKPNGQYNDYNVNKYIKSLEDMNALTIIENKVNDKGFIPRFTLDVEGTILKGYGFQLGKKNRIHPETKENIDQVDYLLHQLKYNPASRRHITTLWNPDDLDEMALTPCVYETQWYVKGNKLSLDVRCRSNDIALGNPFNIFQYNVLQRMIAQVTGYGLGDYSYYIGDCHYYDKHEKGLLEQIQRDTYELPKLWINPDVKNFYEFTIDDFELIDYKYGDKINFEVAI